MIDTQAVIAARNDGRAAEPGDRNPYYGQGLLARMWMRGYMTMLADRIDRSPTRQRYLAREAVIAAFVARTGYRPAAVDRYLRE